MNDRGPLTDELDETFRAELEERLDTMNTALLELEQGASERRRGELLQSLFRDAHSLKGGAQLVGRNEVAVVAHAAEAHLAELSSGVAVSAVELAPLFAAVGTIGRLAESSHVSPAELQQVVADLQGDLDAPVADQPPEDHSEDRITGEHPKESANGGSQRPSRAVPAAGGGVVRVSADRLDALLSRSGELIAARDAADRQQRLLHDLAGNLGARQQRWGELAGTSRRLARGLPEGPLRRLLEEVEAVHTGIVDAHREARAAAGEARVAAQRFGQLVDRLEAELADLRMVPLARLFRPFPRMVRDLGQAVNKPVQLHGVGWDTAIDRDLLERLKDPVMHLLRNAVDHGVEPPEIRRSRAKPATASITLEARREGDRVVIEVCDDGGGIDREAVLRRAGADGWTPADAADGDPALRMIFEPGFSTLDAASAVSGRGVGLDVVATQVAALGGTIAVVSDPTGTTFTMRVPLTLISTRVLMIAAGDHRYAVPIDAVRRVFRFAADEVVVHGGRQTITLDGQSHAVADLSATLGLAATPIEEGRRLVGLLIEVPGAVAAFVVGAVEGEREVVIKQLGHLVGRTPLISGAALVDQDSVVLILDPSGLAASVTGISAARLQPATAPAAQRREADRALRVLVADDSITTRTLEKNILSAAGFDVALAADGREALRTLRLEPFDLVVSDVDMPGIDGFELTERLRANEATRDVPVILVTGKESPDDRERGMRAGADAYVLKSEFDHQALLKTIREVVG